MKSDFPCRRPPLADRRFTSPAVENILTTVKAGIADPELAWLFGNCLPNTLDTTVEFKRDAAGNPDTYVITGDIDAMWLRDSTAQVWPYLPLASQDSDLRDLIAGVIRRQARNVLLDPYANAFYSTSKLGEWRDDHTIMQPGVHERKWELDSLAYCLRLAHGYWAATGDTSPFDGTWVRSVALILATLRIEQAGTDETHSSTYRFRRTCNFGDSLANGGRGEPSLRCGLVRNAFRPSDDLCKLPFLIPSNAMAAAALRDASSVLAEVGETDLARRALDLSAEISLGLSRHGVVEHPVHGRIWAYEVDGYGGAYLMDDANVPSLLSLPYLGVCKPDDALYLRTRAFCLSRSNPYYTAGQAAAGIGSPHTGLGSIWPISLTMQALTSSNDDEILTCLHKLKSTHAGTGFMHESFHRDNAAQFTRAWFAWANTLFGELILTLHRDRPHLLARHF